MSSEDQSPVAAALRLQAEAVARETEAADPLEATSSAALRRTLHELHVHQIELEMQNEELRRVQVELEAARARYFDLYDLAPVGYLTLCERGQILESNINAASLLGSARGTLSKRPFADFVVDEDQGLLRRYLKRLFAGGERQACELRLIRPDRTVFWAHIEGNAAQDRALDHYGAAVCRLAINDNPERQRAEEALRESEQRFKAIADYTVDWESWFGLDGRYRWVNPAVEKITGYTAAEVLAMPDFVAVLIAEEDRAAFRTCFQNAIHGSKGENQEFSYLHKNGVQRWLAVSWQPIYDADGNSLGTRLSGRDITDRKHAQDALADREQLLKLFIEYAPAGLAMFDRQMRYLYTSNVWFANHALDKRDLTGLCHYDVFPELPESWKEAHRRGLAGEVLRSEGDRFERLDGSVKWLRWEIRPWYNAQRSIGGIVIFTEDITEQKKVVEALAMSEALLNSTQRLSKTGGWEWNVEQGTGNWTEETYRIHGFSVDCAPPGSPELIEKSLACYRPEDRAVVLAAFNRCIEEGEPYDIEFPFHSPFRPPMWVRTTAEALRSGGRIVKVVGNIMDITERKRAEVRLLEAKAEAERANNAKSRFLAAASHDLRQPLSALSLYVGVLKAIVPPGSQEVVDNIRECVGSLSELLTDLLDVSKLDAGVVTPNPSDFSVAEVLSHLVSVHSAEAVLKGLSLRWRYSDAIVRTDQQILYRILGNLVSNAIRYTQRGGVLIACRRHQGKRWLEVWDTGIGIAEDQIGRIFEEFRQLGDGARNRGSGLGLAIVAKSAALLKLETRLRSRPGRGSMFAVELPLGESTARELPALGELPEQALRIGLVDDNVHVRESLVIALQYAGHQLIAAPSGSKLIEALDHRRPDIVLADYRLGDGETGFDVIEAARMEFGRELPAILITGDTDPALIRSMADRGIMVCYKPLQMHSLQSLITSLTQR